MRLMDAKHLANFLLAEFAPQTPDLENLFVCEGRQGVAGASVVSRHDMLTAPFCEHVFHVIRLRSDKKMFDVHACGGVTTM